MQPASPPTTLHPRPRTSFFVFPPSFSSFPSNISPAFLFASRRQPLRLPLSCVASCRRRPLLLGAATHGTPLWRAALRFSALRKPLATRPPPPAHELSAVRARAGECGATGRYDHGAMCGSFSTVMLYGLVGTRPSFSTCNGASVVVPGPRPASASSCAARSSWASAPYGDPGVEDGAVLCSSMQYCIAPVRPRLDLQGGGGSLPPPNGVFR